MARWLAQAAIVCIFGTVFAVIFLAIFGLIFGVPGTNEIYDKVMIVGFVTGSMAALLALMLGFFGSLWG